MQPRGLGNPIACPTIIPYARMEHSNFYNGTSLLLEADIQVSTPGGRRRVLQDFQGGGGRLFRNRPIPQQKSSSKPNRRGRTRRLRRDEDHSDAPAQQHTVLDHPSSHLYVCMEHWFREKSAQSSAPALGLPNDNAGKKSVQRMRQICTFILEKKPKLDGVFLSTHATLT